MRRLIVLSILVAGGALSIAIVRAQPNPADHAGSKKSKTTCSSSPAAAAWGAIRRRRRQHHGVHRRRGVVLIDTKYRVGTAFSNRSNR